MADGLPGNAIDRIVRDFARISVHSWFRETLEAASHFAGALLDACRP